MNLPAICLGRALLDFSQKDLIDYNLNQILSKRNNRLYIPHFFVLVLALIINFNEYMANFHLTLPFFMAVTSMIIRYSILRHMFDQFCESKRIKAVYYLAVALTGMSWGLYFSNVTSVKGILSFEGFFAFGVICAFMAGGVTALSASLKASYIYFISLNVIPFVILLGLGESKFSAMAGLILINTVYHIFHAHSSRQLIVNMIMQEKKENSEKNFLQQMIDSIPGVVLIIDANEHYVMVNNYMNGFFRKLVLGKKLGALASSESSVEPILKSFYDCDKFSEVHEVMSKTSGREEWYVMNLRRLDDSKGIMATVLPITELVKARNDLKIHEAKTQYSAQLASLGEMAAGIAHEINNPLTIIEGSSYILSKLVAEKNIDLPMIKLMGEKISATTLRIAKIVKSLRTLSRKSEEEIYAELSPRAILEPCLEISRQRIQGLRINLKLPPEALETKIFGNEVQLSQVLMNLISNAIDAVEDEEKRWIEVRFKESDDWFEIFVTDSGKGVKEELKQKIMEPFFTTKSGNRGTGLGLSISKSIIDNHKGELLLVPNTIHTTFRIRLPIRQNISLLTASA